MLPMTAAIVHMILRSSFIFFWTVNTSYMTHTAAKTAIIAQYIFAPRRLGYYSHTIS